MKNKKTTLSRMLSVMLALVMAVTLSCSVFSVDTYAASSKSQVNTSVNKLMKGIKQCNDRNVNTCMPAKAKNKYYTSIKEILPGTYSYIKAANKKMRYDIIKTSTKGTKATVKVKVTYIDANAFYKNLEKAFYAAILDGSIDMNLINSGNQMSEKEAMELLQTYDNLMLKAFKNTSLSKTKTQTITLKLIKNGKKWELSSIDKNLVNIIGADLFRIFINQYHNIAQDQSPESDVSWKDFNSIDFLTLF